ncbi:hypothetical protein RI367_007597 [Sorochytrium milnesiophthora]
MGKLVWSMLARYMGLTAAAVMADGALWGFRFAYCTVPFLRPTLHSLYAPLNLVSVWGLVVALIAFIIEKPLIRIPLGIKPIFYFLAAVGAFWQFSQIPGMTFFLITAFAYMRAAMNGETMDDALGIKPSRSPGSGKVGPGKV